MGTSMESIQNAYSGFAKSNFTMLDNLRIGYGGTKSEMERLLSDAEKIKAAQGEAVDYSIDSFADIVEAIHVVQKEMGITGTTASEAEHTISGSLSSLKASWDNLITGMARSDSDIGELFDNVLENAKNVVANIAPVVGTVISNIPELVEKIIGELEVHVPEMVQAGADFLGHIADSIPDIVDRITQKIPEIIPAIAAFFKNDFPEIAAAGLELFGQLVGNLDEIIINLAYGLEKILTAIWGEIKKYWPTVAEKGAELFGKLVDKVGDIIQTIKGGIEKVLGSVWDKLKENWGTIKNKGVEFFSKLVEGSQTFIKNITDKVPGVVSAVVDGFKDKWAVIKQAGIDFLSQFGGGVEDTIGKVESIAATLIEKFKGLFDGLIKWINGVFHAAFGSAWDSVAERVGSAFSGIADRVGAIFNTVVEAIKGPINGVIEFLNNLIGGMEWAVNGIIGSLNNISVDIPSIPSPFGGNLFDGVHLGVSIPPVTFDRLNLLAEGGTLKEGQQAIVGEYEPEYLRVVNGTAVVTPMHTGRFGRNGDITINVYPQRGQSEEEIARMVERKLTLWQKQEEAAFA